MDYPKHIIQKGETDKTLVKAIQTQLGKRGTTNVDGVFGDETASAVELFQTLNRDAHNRPIEADGIVGPLT